MHFNPFNPVQWHISVKPQMRRRHIKREVANAASRFMWRRRLSAYDRVRNVGNTSSINSDNFEPNCYTNL